MRALGAPLGALWKKKEPSGRAPGGSLPQLPVQRPVPSLNFDEAREAAQSSLTSHQAVRHAAQLHIILLDKILSTIERNY
jgi:hypothetical protein